MKKVKYIILIAVLVIIAIIVAVYMQGNDERKDIAERKSWQNETSNTEDVVINYTDATIYKKDRTEVKISSFSGKETVILFWNTSNEDSVEMVQRLSSLYEQYKDKVNFVLINTSQEFDDEMQEKLPFEIYNDFYQEAKRNMEIADVPTIIYIRANDEVFQAKYGLSTTDAIEANLDLILGEI